MQAKNKLQSNASFNYVYKNGTSYGDKYFVLVVVTAAKSLRVGFSVSKKVGGSVQRNRVKRQMRECFRYLLPEIKTGYNMVFVARSSVYGIKSSEITNSMRSLLKKADLLAELS